MLKYLIVLGLVLTPLSGGWYAASFGTQVEAAFDTNLNAQLQLQGQAQGQGQGQRQGQTAQGFGGSSVSGSASKSISGSTSSSSSGANANNGGIYNGGTIYPAIPQAPDHSKEFLPFGFDSDAYYAQLLQKNDYSGIWRPDNTRYIIQH